jgi:hypothetical protein
MQVATHHHRGVLSSITLAIVSEIQLIERWLATNGSRSNSTGGGAIFTDEEAEWSAISA